MQQPKQLAAKTNEETIQAYFDAMQTETNPKVNYVNNIRNSLNKLSQFHKNKPFIQMKREDIISYLNSLRKSEEADPLHKWIGTYNSRIRNLNRFFRWLYNPMVEPRQRPKPKLLYNISQLRRKEVSIYKPSDLWTLEDDLLFLKWCPSKRDRCYHAISRDLSARPHEILDLKIKDILIKQAGNKQYAEVLVNGKTGTRHLPLIDSLPYVKEWLDNHPQRNNKNAYFICTMYRANVGGRLTVDSLCHIYTSQYQKRYFPMLIKDPTIPKEYKYQIEALLRKPWNPYIRRHSALTEKSKFLKESTLRQHAGWSSRSQMQLKYVHYFGNESNNSILQEYGILPKNSQEADVLRPKHCPNCNEPNRPDQKFCVKCKLVLSIEAFQDTLEEQRKKDNQIQELMQWKEKMELMLNEPDQFIRMLQEGRGKRK